MDGLVDEIIYNGEVGDWVRGARIRHEEFGDGYIVGYSDFNHKPDEHWIVVEFDIEPTGKKAHEVSGGQRVFGPPDAICPAFEKMEITRTTRICGSCDGSASLGDYLCEECRESLTGDDPT